ncbi:recombination protein RecT [Bacillus haynesii]|nr:recombination protein RecT [Bacillus haynesii]MEC0738743.1 recombination protein RecT [Bacillus haynesii]
MTQAEKLKNDIAKQEQKNEVAQDDKPKTILDVMMKHKESFEMALPKHLDADRLIRLAVTEFRKNPALKGCTPESLLGAVMQAAQVGLEPDALGSAYLVPFKNKKKDPETGKDEWVKEVQLQIGYKGLIELVRRSGQVTSIVANEVYEKDDFDFEYGTNERLYHKPTMAADRGDLKCFYAYARFKDGGHAFTVMSVDQIDQIRDKFSKSQKDGKHFGPWVDHYESMAKKTVIKQLVKYMPISVEIQNQITRDETVHSSFKEEPKPIYAFEESPDIIDAPVEN